MQMQKQSSLNPLLPYQNIAIASPTIKRQGERRVSGIVKQRSNISDCYLRFDEHLTCESFTTRCWGAGRCRWMCWRNGWRGGWRGE